MTLDDSSELSLHCAAFLLPRNFILLRLTLGQGSEIIKSA
jgi:hypothetical protein